MFSLPVETFQDLLETAIEIVYSFIGFTFTCTTFNHRCGFKLHFRNIRSSICNNFSSHSQRKLTIGMSHQSLILIFIDSHSCFLLLLLMAAILWKIKQKYDMFRRRQRLFVEMEQMASRPFSQVNRTKRLISLCCQDALACFVLKDKLFVRLTLPRGVKLNFCCLVQVFSLSRQFYKFFFGFRDPDQPSRAIFHV